MAGGRSAPPVSGGGGAVPPRPPRAPPPPPTRPGRAGERAASRGEGGRQIGSFDYGDGGPLHGRPAGIHQRANRGERRPVSEGPVHHRRGRLPGSCGAGHLGRDAGSPSASGCLHEGELGGDRGAVLDTYGALVAEEQPVVMGDREPWLELAVGGPAAGKGGLFWS